jgi:hypothetical protein
LFAADRPVDTTWTTEESGVCYVSPLRSLGREVALPPIAGRLHHAPSAATVKKIVKQAHAAHATR